MNVKFSIAKFEDLPAIVETYNSTIAGRMVTADLEPVTVADKEKWFFDHSEKIRPLWIVHVNNDYAGWLSFQNFYGRPAYSGTAEVSIYLNENFRGMGLGKICLQKALDECSRLKVHSLLGFIFGHNLASLNLFYSFGFEKWAELPGVAIMDGIPRDLIILGKKI